MHPPCWSQTRLRVNDASMTGVQRRHRRASSERTFMAGSSRSSADAERCLCGTRRHLRASPERTFLAGFGHRRNCPLADVQVRGVPKGTHQSCRSQARKPFSSGVAPRCAPFPPLADREHNPAWSQLPSLDLGLTVATRRPSRTRQQSSPQSAGSSRQASHGAAESAS